MSEIRIITNHVPREVVDAWQLNDAERKDFDYLNWPAIERGEDSASFVRYRGETYDLGDTEGIPPQDVFPGWDQYITDSFFSGVLFRYPREDEYGRETFDTERVIVGRFYS